MEILRRCRDARRDIKAFEGRAARLRECATSATARMDHTGSKPSGVSDKVGALAVELAACDADMKRRKAEHEMELLIVSRILDMLPELECGVLWRYYAMGQAQGEIARVLHYSVSYVKAIKKRGVELVGRLSAAKVAALVPRGYTDQPIEQAGQAPVMPCGE